MASLTTSYISHPWFRTTMKRRHSTEDDSTPPLPTKKRPRVTALEHGFSHMTLNNSITPPTTLPGLVEQQDVSHLLPTSSSSQWSSSSLSAMEIEEVLANSQPSFITRPDSIEEPVSPLPSFTDVWDVKMKGTSWYEPEPDRIIITDLDSSDDEDSPDENQPITISPALLQRIRERDLLRASVPAGHNQALVLYRPLTIPTPSDEKENRSSSLSPPSPRMPEIQTGAQSIVVEVEGDEDKMDI
ncbi:hypothetical protein L218DRAFT_958673, partial [Marasmius fiardii PR-910]